MLRVGIIGCGFMGNMHANCYNNIPDAKVVAVADLRREKAEEVAAGTNAAIYAEGMDLIANAQVDVIDICLPTYLHVDYAVQALEKGIHVICEKPMSLFTEECVDMVRKAEETGKLLIQDSLEKMKNIGTMLIVAHRLSTIQHADNIILLHQGVIVEQGTPEEIFENPQSPKTRAFLENSLERF